MYIWLHQLTKNPILEEVVPWYEYIDHLSTQARHLGGNIEKIFFYYVHF